MATTTVTDECGVESEVPTPLERREQILRQANLNKASDDKFLVVLDLPRLIKNVKQPSTRHCEPVELEDLVVSVHAISLPEIKLGSTKLPYGGHQLAVSPHTRSMDPVTVKYFINNRFTNYWLLWQWSELLSSSQHGFAGLDSDRSIDAQRHDGPFDIVPVQYTTKINVFALEGYNRIVAEWAFTGSFLVSLGGIEYDDQQEDELVSQFTFDYSFARFFLH